MLSAFAIWLVTINVFKLVMLMCLAFKHYIYYGNVAQQNKHTENKEMRGICHTIP